MIYNQPEHHSKMGNLIKALRSYCCLAGTLLAVTISCMVMTLIVKQVMILADHI